MITNNIDNYLNDINAQIEQLNGLEETLKSLKNTKSQEVALAVFNYIQEINSKTVINLESFKAFVLNNSDQKIKKEGLEALNRFQSKMMDSEDKLVEFSKKLEKELKAKLIPVLEAFRHNAHERIPNVKKDLGIQLLRLEVPNQGRLKTITGYVNRFMRSKILSGPFIYLYPTSERPYTTYKIDRTKEAARFIKEMVLNKNDTKPKQLIYTNPDNAGENRGPAMPAVFVTDAHREHVVLNNETILDIEMFFGINENSKNDLVIEAYMKLISAVHDQTVAFRLASLIVQTSFVPLVDHVFKLLERPTPAPSGQHNYIEVRDDKLIISHKICLWNKLDPTQPAILYKRVNTIPIDELRNLSEDRPFVIDSCDFYSSPLYPEAAESELSNF